MVYFNSMHPGVLVGSIALFIGSLGSTLTYPFLQAQRDLLECDALCYGSMQSFRSGLSIFGTVLVGRMSDKYGRSSALWVGALASILSFAISLSSPTMSAMWLAIIPAALLNQNFSVLKALFADYGNDSDLLESDRVAAVGKLGMAAGISFMIGPLIGASLLSSYRESNTAAISLTVLSSLFLFILPAPGKNVGKSTTHQSGASKTEEINDISGTLSNSVWGSVKSYVLDIVYLPAVQTPGARLVLVMRCGMSLAFHVFMTVWTVSLKSRFNFGPKDHAYFMGWIGMWYSLSQGFIARECIRYVGGDPTKLLQVCVLFLSFGRVAVMSTDSLYVVYAVMASIIVALGVMNTAITSACAHLAGRDQLGGLYGVIDAVESLAGLVGPALGGILFSAHPQLPIVTVVVIYMTLFVGIRAYFYEHVMLIALGNKAREDKDGFDTKSTKSSGSSVTLADNESTIDDHLHGDSKEKAE